MIRFSRFAPILGLLAGSSAYSAVAHADTACGSIGGNWNVPRGAIAVAQGGTDPSDTIGQIMVAIKERFAHSMISHGPNSASHATRTTDVAEADEWNGNCTSPLSSFSLKQGAPGAERVTTSGLYAHLYNTDALSTAHNDLKYYDSVQWTTWIAGECKNPKVNYADGTIKCDPIPQCANPHTSLASPSLVTCDSSPGCGDPYVKGSTVFCSVGAPGSTCPTGGHLDQWSGLECLGWSVPDKICTKLKPPSASCSRACHGAIGSDGCPDGPPEGCEAVCLQYKDVPSVNMDQRFGATQAFLPIQAIPSAPNAIRGSSAAPAVSTETNGGLSTVGWLEGQATTAHNGGFQTYGLPYDFVQYMNVNGVNSGIRPAAPEGVVCSTFISYAYANAKNTPIAPYAYNWDDLNAASEALFNATHATCENKGLGDLKQAFFYAQCGGKSVCDAVADQVVNCFATGDCANDDPNLWRGLVNSHKAAPYSISPDDLVGVGRHTNANQGGNPGYLTSGSAPTTTPWARDVEHAAYFSSAGSTYACWE